MITCFEIQRRKTCGALNAPKAVEQIRSWKLVKFSTPVDWSIVNTHPVILTTLALRYKNDFMQEGKFISGFNYPLFEQVINLLLYPLTLMFRILDWPISNTWSIPDKHIVRVRVHTTNIVLIRSKTMLQLNQFPHINLSRILRLIPQLHATKGKKPALHLFSGHAIIPQSLLK